MSVGYPCVLPRASVVGYAPIEEGLLGFLTHLERLFLLVFEVSAISHTFGPNAL